MLRTVENTAGQQYLELFFIAENTSTEPIRANNITLWGWNIYLKDTETPPGAAQILRMIIGYELQPGERKQLSVAHGLLGVSPPDSRSPVMIALRSVALHDGI